MSIPRLAPRMVPLLAAAALCGCGTTIYGLKVPLAAPPPALTTSTGAQVRIDDRRPQSQRVVHTGGGLLRCERWYGDDTYAPPKPELLAKLLAARAGGALLVKLERFDTVEYCENTARQGAAAAAYGAAAGAGGTPIYTPAAHVPLGDSVLVRLAGEVNGRAFDVRRQFDYSDLRWRLTEMPAANPQYRERLSEALGQLADAIVARAAMPLESASPDIK